MKKSVYNKKFIFSVLIIFLVLAISLVLIKAQTDTAPTDVVPTSATQPAASENYCAGSTSADASYFQRWVCGTFKDSQAKILLFILMFALLYMLIYSLSNNTLYCFLLGLPSAFILTAYVTPGAIIGIFKSYETLPLTIATFLPLGILFGVTYMAITKQKKVLITSQWLLWCIYFGYNALRLCMIFWVWTDGTWSKNIREIINMPMDLSGAGSEIFWFWCSAIVVTVVSGFMVFAGDKLVDFAMRKTASLEDDVAKAKMKKAAGAINNLGQFTTQISTS
jgi:hypothetical protein